KINSCSAKPAITSGSQRSFKVAKLRSDPPRSSATMITSPMMARRIISIPLTGQETRDTRQEMQAIISCLLSLISSLLSAVTRHVPPLQSALGQIGRIGGQLRERGQAPEPVRLAAGEGVGIEFQPRYGLFERRLAREVRLKLAVAQP